MPVSMTHRSDTTVAALVALTRAVLPAMLDRGTGGVVNVASTIAFQPGAYQAVYGETKAFVLSFSEAVRVETRGTGVRVLTLCPGPVDTGFLAGLGDDRAARTAIRPLARGPAPLASRFHEVGCPEVDHKHGKCP